MNTKQAQRETLELMCRNKPVTRLPTAPRPEFAAHTGVLIPTAEQFSEGYLASILGDLAIMPVIDFDGQIATEAPIARKRGQEWRDEVELQESGVIVGYWGSDTI